MIQTIKMLWAQKTSRRTMLKASLLTGTGMVVGLGLGRSAHAAGNDILEGGLVGSEGPVAAGMARDVQHSLPPGRIQMNDRIGQRMADCMTNLVTALDLERLIKPFRDKTDGLKNQWRCDFWGKWFTALAWGYTHRPTTEHRQLMDRAVKELIGTQGSDGNIGSFEGQMRLVGDFDVWGRQCAILGLVAHYDLTGDKSSLDAACRVLDCLIDELEQKKARIVDLGNSSNGLPPSVAIESGALLYQRTGLQKYRDFSEGIVAQWNEPGRLAPNGLRLVEDALAGKPAREVGNPKAYEQMYCFIGICELYRATGQRKYLDAAVLLAQNIRSEELFVTGTGSADVEVWREGRTLQTRALYRPGETCVTAHWMILCWQLLRLTGDPVYADEMELSLYNALQGALMPKGNWWAYHNATMGMRVPSWVQQSDTGLSCCVVSGSRALAMTPLWAVMQVADGPLVNLYFQGKAEAQSASGGNVSLVMDTDYPREGSVLISVKPAQPETFTIALRIPAWSEATVLKVNGDPQPAPAGTYAKIHRLWKEGDRLEIAFDMRARILDAPDGNGHLAIKRGPIVLAFDERLTPPQNGAVAVLERTTASLADAKTNPVATEKCGVWMAVDVPFVVNGEKRMLTMCDYASAGNQWSDGNRYRTWFSQPLDLGSVYETGYTWQMLSEPRCTTRPTPPIHTTPR